MHNAIYTSASIATQSIAMNFLRYLFMYATIHGDIIAARPVAHEYLFVTYSFSFSFRVSSDPYFDSRELSRKGRGGGGERKDGRLALERLRSTSLATLVIR